MLACDFDAVDKDRSQFPFTSVISKKVNYSQLFWMAQFSATLQNINDVYIEQIYNCRICLQPCQEEEYCLCRRDLKLHQTCLVEFLKRKPKGPDFGKCEICCQNYKLVESVKYLCAFSQLCNKVRHSLSRCICEIIIIGITIGYLCFFGWNSARASAKEEVMITATTILAVCAIILLLATLVVWVREFTIDVVREIISVQPWNEPEPDRLGRSNQIANVAE